MDIHLFTDQSSVYNIGNTSNWTWLWTSICSLTIAITIFFLTRWNDKRKSREQTIKLLKSDIFSLCEKLIRYALNTNEIVLNSKYYYAMYRIGDNDSEIDKAKHIDYAKKCSGAALQINMMRADLIEKTLQLEVYLDDKKKANKIIELMGTQKLLLLKDFNGIFNKNMNKNEIDSAYTENKGLIKKHVLEDSLGKELRDIQFIIHPMYLERLEQKTL